MSQLISPAQRLIGTVQLPGDKSISHRAAMLASIAEGPSTLLNFSTGADCHSTLGCMQALGVPIRVEGTTVFLDGVGLHGLRAAAAPLDAGNSGSTIRMLAGILAGQPFSTTIVGDESLTARPMQRIMQPLTEMGATLTAREGKFPPLTIQGRRPLRAIDYRPPVPSAQVKTCVLFGGLFAEGTTIVREAIPTRDHSEMALREFGADVVTAGEAIRIGRSPRLTGREFHIPGDLSSAAFFLVAATLTDGSAITIESVGLNPSRTALLDYLMGLGADIRVERFAQKSGEMTGDLTVKSSRTKAGVIAGAQAAALIDEIPVLAVLGAAGGGLEVRDAGELRVKETDRIATLAENFKRAGVAIDVRPDGFSIPGGQAIRAAEFDSFGDHRIAMAFAVAGLLADGPSTMLRPYAASVSFPEFYKLLAGLMQ